MSCSVCALLSSLLSTSLVLKKLDLNLKFTSPVGSAATLFSMKFKEVAVRPHSVLNVSVSAVTTTLHSVTFLSGGALESDFREILEKCDDKEREDIKDMWSSARALSRTKHMDCLSFFWNSSHKKT